MFEECRLEGDFTLSSGRKSTVFYDFDLLKPAESAEYIEQLVRQIPPSFWRKVDFIASPALGGIVPGFLVAFATKKPLVIVDKAGKPRGPEFKAGSYVIVDDVITSFTAANFVKASLAGKECVGMLAYIFRGTYQDLTANKDVPIYYLARKEQEE